MVVHTIEAPLLLDYASGALSEAMSLAMATHLSLSPKGAATYQALNEIGGMMLDEAEYTDADYDAAESAALDADQLFGGSDDLGLSAVMDRLDEEPVQPREIQFNAVTTAVVPSALRKYLAADLDSLAWRKVGPGVEEFEIKGVTGSEKTSLLRIEAGRAMPQHTHDGRELTVVLDGCYVDGGETYARGDLQVADGADDHQPVADETRGCICFVTLEAPVKLTGKVGRFLNPFIRF